MDNCTIDMRVYKLFLKLSDKERNNFLKDLLKLNDTHATELLNQSLTKGN
jgi:hypothetical protein